MTQPSLTDARRVVVKIGTLLISDPATGSPRIDWLNSVAQDIAELRATGAQVIVVSSGAVAFGRAMLNLPLTLRLTEKQAAAACGQIRLVEAWALAFGAHQIQVAQMLLTAADTENRRRYLNARRTVEALLDYGVVPIINENDSVTTEEIRYGDNDRLAARVAAMASADRLILLSDIDGLYSADPRSNPDAHFIPLIERITPEIEAMAGGARSAASNGGMRTKIMAAQMAVSAGCHMAIAPGHDPHPLRRIRDGGRCSWFAAQQSPLGARKHWIAHSLQATGAVVIDAGAAQALARGNSLLPVGVKRVEGRFERGDTVRIVDASGRELGKGLIAYSADEAARLCGAQSDKIESILGYQGRSEMIHLDDMALDGDEAMRR